MGSTSIALCVLLSKKFKPKQKQLIFHLRKSPTIWRRVYVSLSLIRTTCTRPIKRNDESGARSHALSFTRLIIQQTITKCSIRFNISNELETKFVTNADSKFWSFEKDKQKKSQTVPCSRWSSFPRPASCRIWRREKISASASKPRLSGFRTFPGPGCWSAPTVSRDVSTPETRFSLTAELSSMSSPSSSWPYDLGPVLT